MQIIVIGIWLVVCSIVGSRSAQDMAQERRDHKTVADLIRQERELKAGARTVTP